MNFSTIFTQILTYPHYNSLPVKRMLVTNKKYNHD